jgi:phosphohistidine swiveling domain-containing protein
LGDLAFAGGKTRESVVHTETDVEKEIHELKTFKDSVLIEEWRFLKELLELREQWKMEILRPYSHIRFISLELGSRTGIGNDVFHLAPSEVVDLSFGKVSVLEMRKLITERKKKQEAFNGIYLPDVLLKKNVAGRLDKSVYTDSTMKGTPLSSGIVKGTVRVIKDLNDADLSNWPEDAILVAPATDPGWTALFTRSRGVIVERGGVLNHCAILARELGLPSINLARATQVLKDGDKIWLDGQHGGVKHDNA